MACGCERCLPAAVTVTWCYLCSLLSILYPLSVMKRGASFHGIFLNGQMVICSAGRLMWLVVNMVFGLRPLNVSPQGDAEWQKSRRASSHSANRLLFSFFFIFWSMHTKKHTNTYESTQHTHSVTICHSVRFHCWAENGSSSQFPHCSIATLALLSTTKAETFWHSARNWLVCSADTRNVSNKVDAESWFYRTALPASS